MSARTEMQAEPRVRLPVAVLAILATVVVALLAVALVVRLEAVGLPTGPPRDPPAAPPEAVAFSVDAGRTARLEEFSLTLPGAPFRCSGAQDPPPGFAAYVGCTHTVHADYDGAGHDWSALTGVLVVDDSLVEAGDLTATTTAVFDALVDRLYSAGDHYSLSKVSSGDVQVPVPAGRAASRLADVDVKKKGLATPYDRLVVVVVRLESGRHVVFFSDFPHDDSAAALRAVTTSLNTISVQRR
ncbi:MAG TPA: hypothetical protein VGC37_07755 [Friedmanniella sp.]